MEVGLACCLIWEIPTGESDTHLKLTTDSTTETRI